MQQDPSQNRNNGSSNGVGISSGKSLAEKNTGNDLNSSFSHDRQTNGNGSGLNENRELKSQINRLFQSNESLATQNMHLATEQNELKAIIAQLRQSLSEHQSRTNSPSSPSGISLSQSDFHDLLSENRKLRDGLDQKTSQYEEKIATLRAQITKGKERDSQQSGSPEEVEKAKKKIKELEQTVKTFEKENTKLSQQVEKLNLKALRDKSTADSEDFDSDFDNLSYEELEELLEQTKLIKSELEKLNEQHADKLEQLNLLEDKCSDFKVEYLKLQKSREVELEKISRAKEILNARLFSDGSSLYEKMPSEFIDFETFQPHPSDQYSKQKFESVFWNEMLAEYIAGFRYPDSVGFFATDPSAITIARAVTHFNKNLRNETNLEALLELYLYCYSKAHGTEGYVRIPARIELFASEPVEKKKTKENNEKKDSSEADMDKLSNIEFLEQKVKQVWDTPRGNNRIRYLAETQPDSKFIELIEKFVDLNSKPDHPVVFDLDIID